MKIILLTADFSRQGLWLWKSPIHIGNSLGQPRLLRTLAIISPLPLSRQVRADLIRGNSRRVQPIFRAFCASPVAKYRSRVCPSIDLVCSRNIWKETQKLLDPDKLGVGNSLSFARVNPQTQSSNLRAWAFLSYKRVIGLIGTEKPCPMFVEIKSNSIDGQTRP